MDTERGSAHEATEEHQGVVASGLQWASSEGLTTIYANQLAITHAGPEFYLIFGEAVPPIALTKEEMPETVYIKPVARIAVSREAMLGLADTIAANVQRFKNLLERARQEAGVMQSGEVSGNAE